MATPAILPEQPDTLTPSFLDRHRPLILLIQAALLVITFATTTLVGMRYMDNFRHGRFPLSSEQDILPFQWLAHNLRAWPTGLPFSVTLLAILLTHEFAHFAACTTHGIPASLPYLIPAPSLSGTMGAVIRLRARVTSRSALLAIGSSGPIAGFAVAIVTTCIGLRLSVPVSVSTPPPSLFSLKPPLLITGLGHLTPSAAHGPLLWHPILVASWIGLLVTSLNLIPAGQLDGGHILYALSPRIHRRATTIAVIALCLLGIFAWIGWFLWAVLLLIPAMRHPRVADNTPIQGRQKLLPPLCLLLFLLTATPAPFPNTSLLTFLHWLHH